MKRTRATKNVSRRRRRVYRRRVFRRNPNLRTQVYSFNRSCALLSQAQTVAVSGFWSSGLQFTLANLPNVSEFQNLFDHYYISYVKLYFQLNIDPAAGAASTAAYPVMYYARDYDDVAAPTNLDDMYQHGNLKRAVLHPNRLVTIGIRPATNELVFNGVTSSYSPKWRQWVDMANTGVPFYGLKFALENWNLPGSALFIRAKYWIKCKGTR